MWWRCHHTETLTVQTRLYPAASLQTLLLKTVLILSYASFLFVQRVSYNESFVNTNYKYSFLLSCMLCALTIPFTSLIFLVLTTAVETANCATIWLIFNLGARWRWKSSFTHRPLYLYHGTHWINDLMAPTVGPDSSNIYRDGTFYGQNFQRKTKRPAFWLQYIDFLNLLVSG